MRNVSDKKIVQKIKTHIFYSINFIRKSYHLWDNVEKYSRAGKATETTWRMACWIPKTRNTNLQYVSLYLVDRASFSNSFYFFTNL